MPDYRCHDCGCTFDLEEGVRPLETMCPDCGSGRWGLMPTKVSGGVWMDKDWSSENNGKGRRISQLDHGIRQPYYAKSQDAAINEAKRRDLTVTKA
jgi:hypothetical protein